MQKTKVDVIAEKDNKYWGPSHVIDKHKLSLSKNLLRGCLGRYQSKLEIRFDVLYIIIGGDKTEIMHTTSAF